MPFPLGWNILEYNIKACIAQITIIRVTFSVEMKLTFITHYSPQLELSPYVDFHSN